MNLAPIPAYTPITERGGMCSNAWIRWFSTVLVNEVNDVLNAPTPTTAAGWVDNGTVVRLETSTDKVIIGHTSNPADTAAVGSLDAKFSIVNNKTTEPYDYLLSLVSYSSTGPNSSLAFFVSRGTYGSETAIQSGDTIGSIVGWGYNSGATDFRAVSSFVMRARENYSSSSTNAAAFEFWLTELGASSTAQRFRMYESILEWTRVSTTNPLTTDLTALASSGGFAIYCKNSKFVIAYNLAGTINYLRIALDGSATTWVHNTTAP